jgi:dynein heavy chain
MQLFDIVKRACSQHFRQDMDKVLADLIPEGVSALEDSHVRCLFFGNYMEPDADPKIYDEVNKYQKLNYTTYQVPQDSFMSLFLFFFFFFFLSKFIVQIEYLTAGGTMLQNN